MDHAQSTGESQRPPPSSFAQLYDHLLAANADPSVRAIVITGTGSGFCAGADLKSRPGEVIEGGRSVPYPLVLTTIIESPKPVIAAVNGAAFAGGLGLVGAADIVDHRGRRAVQLFRGAHRRDPGCHLGEIVVPKLGPHGGWSADRRALSAPLEYGLLHRVVPAAELAAAVAAEVDAIARACLAVREAKQLVRTVSRLPEAEAYAFGGRRGRGAARRKRRPRACARCRAPAAALGSPSRRQRMSNVLRVATRDEFSSAIASRLRAR